MVEPQYLTWAYCIQLYRGLQEQDRWRDYATGMLYLIEAIQQDATFPEVSKGNSMHWLRLGLPNDHYTSKWLHVWIGWREPNSYFLALTFASYEKTIIPADKIIPAIKFYIRRIVDLQNTHFREERAKSKKIKRAEMWEKENLADYISESPSVWLDENILSAIRENTDDAYIIEMEIKRGERAIEDLNANDAKKLYNLMLNIRNILEVASEIQVEERSKNLIKELENTT